MIVLSPATGDDFKGMIKAAIRDPNPVVVLEHELLYNESFDMSPESASTDFLTPIGKAKVELAGKDVTLVSYSRGVSLSLKVKAGYCVGCCLCECFSDSCHCLGCCVAGEGRHQRRGDQSAVDSSS